MNKFQNLKRLYLKAKEILERSSNANDPESRQLRSYPVEYYENLRYFVDMCEDSGIKIVARSIN